LWNPDSGKFFFVESGILGLESGTQLKIQIPPTIGIRNPLVPLTTNPESGTWNPESMA